MVFSTQKPAEIVVLRTIDDIKAGTCKVQYAFRFAIKEAAQPAVEYDAAGNPAQANIQGWQYEEIIDEMTIPLYLKPTLALILRTAYENAVRVLEQNLNFARTEISAEINAT